ncbi:MAG: hypothetical protein ACI88L_000361 [Candidatus Paceibacteria bacterium]|jgi:hypothetical protein
MKNQNKGIFLSILGTCLIFSFLVSRYGDSNLSSWDNCCKIASFDFTEVGETETKEDDKPKAEKTEKDKKADPVKKKKGRVKTNADLVYVPVHRTEKPKDMVTWADRVIAFAGKKKTEKNKVSKKKRALVDSPGEARKKIASKKLRTALSPTEARLKF